MRCCRPPTSRFGPPVLRPPSVRDFYAFEGHVRAMWARRGGTIPERWYTLADLLLHERLGDPRAGRPDPCARAAATSSTTSWRSRPSSTRPASDLPPERAEEVIGGYTIFDDFSARDLQREEMALHLGPAKGKDFASAFGPYLVTPDELADRRQGTGFDLAMTVDVNGVETGRGRWADAQFSFGEMLARASADVAPAARRPDRQRHRGHRVPPQTKDETLGRYLEPGDVVTLAIERLGELRNPIVARPA